MKRSCTVTRTCGNCGQAFPPCNPDHTGRYVYCSEWDTTKEAARSCKAWADDTFSAGAAPYWCEPYTKRRLTQDEIDANQTAKAVRMRLNAMENNGTFKRKAAAHLVNGQRPSVALVTTSTLSIPQTPVPYKSQKVQLQEQRIERTWTQLERLEAAPPEYQWTIARYIKAALREMDNQIDKIPF